MGMRRLNLAHMYVLPIFLAGCALSHDRGIEEAEPPTEEMVTDPSSCEIREAHLDIGISTAPGSSEPCEPGPVEGWIDGTLVEAGGVTEFILDTCPLDADCDASRRCQIHLEGHEVPLAPTLSASESALFGWVEPGFLRLSFDRGDCLTCDRTVLYARDANPDAPPPDPGDLSFARGEDLCGEDCGLHPFTLVASSSLLGGHGGRESVSVRPGETLALSDGGLEVRLLSSRRDECTDVPGVASWITWFDPSSDSDDAPLRSTDP
jgi:hypothetical protein